MDLKYTEVPGATLVALMAASWVVMLLAALMSALIG
jgi:hypothetical protein